MSTKIVTTITSPGKLRLAATFEIPIGAPAGPVFDYVAGKESCRKFSPATAQSRKSSGPRPRDKPGRGRAPTT